MKKIVAAIAFSLTAMTVTVAAAGDREVVLEATNGDKSGFAHIRNATNGGVVNQVLSTNDIYTRTSVVGDHVSVKFYRPNDCATLLIFGNDSEVHTYRACHNGEVYKRSGRGQVN